MIKNIIALALTLFVSTGCVDNFRGYFKRSANNKVIDNKGFQQSKRAPLYNKKYITVAKKNIIEENYDDDDDNEDDNLYALPAPGKLNRQMYMDMVREDNNRRKRQRLQQYRASYADSFDDDYDDYPSLGQANRKINKGDIQEQHLQKELKEIKSMLSDARKDLAKYKCPMQKE